MNLKNERVYPPYYIVETEGQIKLSCFLWQPIQNEVILNQKSLPICDLRRQILKSSDVQIHIKVENWIDDLPHYLSLTSAVIGLLNSISLSFHLNSTRGGIWRTINPRSPNQDCYTQHYKITPPHRDDNIRLISM